MFDGKLWGLLGGNKETTDARIQYVEQFDLAVKDSKKALALVEIHEVLPEPATTADHKSIDADILSITRYLMLSEATFLICGHKDYRDGVEVILAQFRESLLQHGLSYQQCFRNLGTNLREFLTSVKYADGQ